MHSSRILFSDALVTTCRINYVSPHSWRPLWLCLRRKLPVYAILMIMILFAIFFYPPFGISIGRIPLRVVIALFSLMFTDARILCGNYKALFRSLMVQYFCLFDGIKSLLGCVKIKRIDICASKLCAFFYASILQI